MKTEWDYTVLADAYLQRPDYAQPAIDQLLGIANIKSGDPVCDVGAGVAHLTLMLAHHGCRVVAVEPNDAMRANGIKRTSGFENVQWHEGTGEATGQADNQFKLVTFGSSFNVTDRAKSLIETARILKPSGWFACMWNHRDLADTIQHNIEAIIRNAIPEYGYGTRREDQVEIIDASGLFNSVQKISGSVIHRQSIEECIEAWRSHATLARQAGTQFAEIVGNIAIYLRKLGMEYIEIPYTTNIWAAQLKANA